jgi:hypothetical protein
MLLVACVQEEVKNKLYIINNVAFVALIAFGLIDAYGNVSFEDTLGSLLHIHYYNTSIAYLYHLYYMLILISFV